MRNRVVESPALQRRRAVSAGPRKPLAVHLRIPGGDTVAHRQRRTLDLIESGRSIGRNRLRGSISAGKSESHAAGIRQHRSEERADTSMSVLRGELRLPVTA
jgi:hypothetical protein